MSSNIKIYVSRQLIVPSMLVGMLAPMALTNSGVSFFNCCYLYSFLGCYCIFGFKMFSKKGALGRR